MDYLTEGINQGNLFVTSMIMLVLVIASTKARFLDTAGVASAVFVGLLVGVLGHWSWLLILLSFLVFSHLATKWKFEEKKAKNMSESDDGHRGWVNVFANRAKDPDDEHAEALTHYAQILLQKPTKRSKEDGSFIRGMT